MSQQATQFNSSLAAMLDQDEIWLEMFPDAAPQFNAGLPIDLSNTCSKQHEDQTTNPQGMISSSACLHEYECMHVIVEEDDKAPSPIVLPADDELLQFSVKELNRRLRKLPPDEAVMVKNRRRTLKNRQYAQVCRQRRSLSHVQLLAQVDALRQRIRALETQLSTALKHRDYYCVCLQQLMADSS